MSLRPSSAWLAAARRTGWALALLATLLFLQSAFLSERSPAPLKLLLAGLMVLAAIKPSVALLIVTAVIPFGHVLTVSPWPIYPFALSEAIVLAFFAGYLWSRRRADAGGGTDSLLLPSLLFFIVVLCSSVVQLAKLQVLNDFSDVYWPDLFTFFRTAYLTTLPDSRPWIDGRSFIPTATLLVEGIGLMLCARRLSREDPKLAGRLLSTMVAAGAVVAVLSFYHLAAEAARRGEPIAMLIARYRWGSPAIPSVDTAGPYFMLIAFLAAGLAAGSGYGRSAGLAALLLSIGAIWLTRTRVAIVSGLAVASAGAALLAIQKRAKHPIGLRHLAAAAAIAIAIGAVLVIYNPFDLLATGGARALRMRALSAETALNMMKSAPVFGVGVGQYTTRYSEFAPRALLRNYQSIDAHNYLLWLGAEIGAIGLLLFIVIMAVTVRDTVAASRQQSSNTLLICALFGLAAFMATWSIGQPISIPHVAFVFWLAIGVVSGVARTSAPSPRRVLAGRGATVAVACALAALLPVRIHEAVGGINLSSVSYGFYNTNVADGRDFTWAGPRVRFYQHAAVKAIVLPLAAKHPDTPHGADVEILVNGHVAQRLTLGDSEWHDIRLNAPSSDEPFWQIDLIVTPIDVPADLPDDRRRICVGQVTAARVQQTPSS